jgi:hypothetical protein
MATDRLNPVVRATAAAAASLPFVKPAKRARIHARLGRDDLDRNRTATAIAHYLAAVTLNADNSRARRKLLDAAAITGDREVFYANLTAEMRSALGTAELAGLLAELGAACREAGDWRGAADAFHDAHKTEPKHKGWKSAYMRLRRYTPDWGFYSLDPKRAWDLADYPDAAVKGLVAPIHPVVIGWLPATAAENLVTLKLNGTEIAETQASERVELPDGREYLQFSRNVRDLWTFAGAGDTLTIEANGHKLPIIGRGETFPFRRKDNRTDELLTKLKDGFVLNKYGRVMPSISTDDEWQVGIFDLYAKLCEDLNEEFGLTLFPFYGTMLGAVREQDFIGHDNDFDTIYVSEKSEPEAVRREFKELCGFLLSRGYDLKVKSTHTWVKVPGTSHKLDIFFGWFNNEDLFDVSYGYHGVPVQKSPEFFDLRTEKLGRFEIPAPSNAEALLSQLYGPTWRTPDQGFAHQSNSRKIDRRYHLTTADVNELYWSQFYRDHKPDHASRFATFVAERFETTGTLVEFGCGSGRDGIYFANRGWTTFCCDRSPEAIAGANEVRTASRGLPVSFDVVDVADPGEIHRFVTGLVDGAIDARPLIVYLRFFLHAIDESMQDTLLDTITSEIPGEFYLCAEFRTVEDRDLAKVHGSHYRRYIDHEQFAKQLSERWGFQVEHLEAGQGLSPYDGEDPFLSRIIARRPIAKSG